MATIIDYTYFVGGFTAIAQVGQPAVLEKVNAYIANYEPYLLRILLGPALYTETLTNAQLPAPAQKWVDLLDGVDYTAADGTIRHWDGLRHKPKNLISHYVYYQWLGNSAVFLTGTGTVMPKNENATRESPIGMQVPIWNEMTEFNYQLFSFLQARAADFPTWPYIGMLTNCTWWWWHTIDHSTWRTWWYNWCFAGSWEYSQRGSLYELFCRINRLNL